MSKADEVLQSIQEGSVSEGESKVIPKQATAVGSISKAIDGIESKLEKIYDKLEDDEHRDSAEARVLVLGVTKSLGELRKAQSALWTFVRKY